MSRWRWVSVVIAVAALGFCYWLGARPYRPRARHVAALTAPAPLGLSRAEGPIALPQAAPSASPSALPVPVISAVFPVIPVTPTTTPPFEYTDNYLLAGLDRRPFGGGAGLSDTLLVAVFDEPQGALG